MVPVINAIHFLRGAFVAPMSLVKQWNRLLEGYRPHKLLGSENWINYAVGENPVLYNPAYS